MARFSECRGGRRLRARRSGRGLPRRARVDPPLHRGDFLRGQRIALCRHRRALEARDPAIQPARAGVARDEVRSARAAAQRAVTCAEVQLAQLDRVAVARPAAALQNRLDVFGK